MPSGMPINDARARIRPDPTIAFPMPPPGSPTGFGACVRKAQLIEPTPFITRYAKIANKGTITRIVDPTANNVSKLLDSLRVQLIGSSMRGATTLLAIGPRWHSARRHPHQCLRKRVHNQRHDE